jgi:hypothetical protein
MKQFLIAIDQGINTLIYIPGDGFGMADEAISARVVRCYLQDLTPEWPINAIDALFFWEESHCMNSWRAEFARNQLPSHYR